MTKARPSRLLLAAVLATALFGWLLPAPTGASPILNTELELWSGSAWVSSLNVTSGSVYTYRLVSKFSAIGTRNSDIPSAGQLTSLVPGTDGITGQAAFDLKQGVIGGFPDTTNWPVTVSFGGPLTLSGTWGAGSSAGTLTPRGTTGCNDLIGISTTTGGPYVLDNLGFGTNGLLIGTGTLTVVGTSNGTTLNTVYGGAAPTRTWTGNNANTTKWATMLVTGGTAPSGWYLTSADPSVHMGGQDLLAGDTNGVLYSPAIPSALGNSNGFTTGFYAGVTASSIHSLGTAGGADGVVPRSLFTVASLVGGNNKTGNGGGTATILMSFRQRLPIGIETTGTTGGSYNYNGISSDVLQLIGMQKSATNRQSDPYVLQMSYNASLMPGVTDTTAGPLGQLFLMYANGTSWTNAIAGDVTPGASALTNYQGSYSGFMAYTNAVKTTTLNRLSINTLLAPYVGSWGVDTTNDNVWAVLDYSAMAGTPLTPAYFATSYGLPTGGVGTVDAKGSFLLTPQTTSTNMLFGNVLRGAVVPGMTATIHNIGDLGAVGMDATYQNDLASPFSGAVSATNIALGGPPAVQTITLNTGTSGNYADAATFLCYNTGTVTPLQTTLLLNASATVGWGKADRSNSMSAFGAALTALVGTPSGTYANLESNVHEEINGPAGAPMLGSVATILWGTNLTGSDTGVSMAWRTRLNAASVPNEQSFLISDVLRLTGMNNSLASPQTDKFVLQMKYSEAELLIHLAGGRTEADVAAAGLLYLETWDPTLGTSGMWANAISTNINNDPTAPHGVLGAFDPGISNDLKLGAWGVDVNNDVVWAVLDHNGDFAVAPEPATMAFLMFGGMAMAGAGIARRRRGSKKS